VRCPVQAVFRNSRAQSEPVGTNQKIHSDACGVVGWASAGAVGAGEGDAAGGGSFSIFAEGFTQLRAQCPRSLCPQLR
jgi:hypothetical protein